MSKNRSKVVPDSGFVQIRGARQNNLKGFDLDLPLGKLNVITGPSGSGKSSLAFDTIYAEGQRRYVETFSPYTRQFLERMDKPKVDEIRGIPPAIAIEQTNNVKTSRSTVGTMTEINDYLKVLFPKVAQAFCPSCRRGIRPETEQSILDQLYSENAAKEMFVTFGVPVPAGTKPKEFFAFLQQQGYLRVWGENRVHRTDENSELKRLPGVVQVIQDRVVLNPESRARVHEALETALRFGKGKIALIIPSSGELLPFSTGWHCAHCDVEITPPSPGLFSFNNPLGACPACRGFGRVIGIDYQRAIPDRSLSLAEGAIKPFQTESGRECQRDLMRAAAANEIDVHIPFEELPESDQRWVIHGERPDANVDDLWQAGLWYGVRGYFAYLESKAYKMHVRVQLSRYRSYTTCNDCGGGRFQPAALNYRVEGKTLPELSGLPVRDLAQIIAKIKAGVSKADSATLMLVEEVASRVNYLVEVGVGYLSLDRQTRTLSGGEVERVNLTTCLGASLVNTLFVLDEPTVGLHPRDVQRMIQVMKELRDRGNTLLVVEHDEAVMRAAENLIELGPGRGDSGGELVFNGPLGAMKTSLTADYLQGRKFIPVPKKRRKPSGWLELKGVTHHNLRKLDASFPLGVFACVTGVSGSGKSTLVHDVLYQNLLRKKGMVADEEEAGFCRKITGDDRIERIVMVDQSPLSRTPRSNPALYLGVFDSIRDLFAKLPESIAQGLNSSAFSFNSGAGRCERCGGAGCEKIEMQFLSDLFVRCPECDGKRYQTHILAIELEGKSIHDVLEMTVAEAIAFFSELGENRIAKPLQILEEVGLAYLKLGQPLNFLSGGESQRLKLVSHLAQSSASAKSSGSLLLLDEPTTGLHLDDIAVLVKVFDRLVEQGNSLLVIEHNDEVIKCADYLIDLGPEAGDEGGLIIAEGTPEEVAKVQKSHTGRFVAAALKRKPVHSGGRSSRDAAFNPAPESSQTPQPSREVIEIHGAREHNLKDISLEIPRGKMVVVTGLSGSGKSTLAFDILFAEGQRRFLDSMSPYARQFVEQLEKPEVDVICGLPPTVAIEQRVTRGGGKSTVATVTEIYHFLRLLFAKVGTQFCPKCQLPVEKQSQAEIFKQAQAIARKGPVKVLAPLIKARKGFHTDVAKWAIKQGFEELLVDGRFVNADGFEKLDRFREHSIDVVVGSSPERLKEDLARALEIGRGAIRLLNGKNISTLLSTEMSCPGCGRSFEELDPRLFSFNSPHGWCEQCHGFGEIWSGGGNSKAESVLEMELEEERRHEWLEEGEARPCPACAGARLNEMARNVQIQGRSIHEITRQSVREAAISLASFRLTGNAAIIATDIVSEIEQRLRFMGKVGLDYLQLNRSAKTLSGGESQRIRLAAQLGSNLRGVLYILDEPTIGLHPRDNVSLLETLDALKQKGNSLIVVEHDEETMARADLIIDLGPKAGAHGGEVTASGTVEQIKKNPSSITGRFLAEPLQHPTCGQRRSLKTVENWIELSGAAANNLKAIDVRFPIGRLSVITGVSGSGKSTLMRQVILPSVQAALASKKKKPEPLKNLKELNGAEFLEAVYEIDQSPIGKTSRSIPATYIGFFDDIRKQFAQIPLARMRGYTASRFSFNNEGGRCERCQGQGVIKVEMNFLPTSYLPCDSCGGMRYNPATLEVQYNGKSIGEVLNLTFQEAAEFFHANPSIHRPLSLLVDTGLGYLKLGQPSPTLSGGEAQRLKLVTELTRGLGRQSHTRLRKGGAPKSTLYLLEEPTIGLHMADVAELLKVLHRLVDDGNTVIVIEHNLSLIADADYIVDIGPNAGAEGGKVVACGSPEQIAKSKPSRTAPFLRELLAL